MRSDEDHNQDEDYDPEDLDPSWPLRRRSTICSPPTLAVQGTVRQVAVLFRMFLALFIHAISLRDTAYRSSHRVLLAGVRTEYGCNVPKLWNETIEAHRRAVFEAILDTTWRLVAEQGLRAVTMSQIAEESGIGRATLYKYFPDVEGILHTWHERHISAHLKGLTELLDQTPEPGRRLEAVLEAYAFICQHRGGELGALLHQEEYITGVKQQLTDLISGVLAEAAQRGEIRADVEPQELARYCLHALAAASSLASNAAVHRLIEVTMAGLHAPGLSGTYRRGAHRHDAHRGGGTQ